MPWQAGCGATPSSRDPSFRQQKPEPHLSDNSQSLFPSTGAESGSLHHCLSLVRHAETMESLPAEQPEGCPAVLGLWKADGCWRERSDWSGVTGQGGLSWVQAQGIGHELMTLGLIVAEPSTCTDVPGKADPQRHIPTVVLQSCLLPAQPDRPRCPRAVPTSDGDKWYLGRQSSTAKLCPGSQDQHSPWTGTPQGHQLGWLSLKEGTCALAAVWGYLGQSATTLTPGPSLFSPLIPGPCPPLPHFSLFSYPGLHN